MFVNFGEPLEMFSCNIEVEIDGNISRQTISAPQMILTTQFMNIVQQSLNTSQRVRAKMSRMVHQYGEWDRQWHDIEHYIEFKNNPYLQNEESSE